MLKPLIIIMEDPVIMRNRPSYINDRFVEKGFNPIRCQYNVASIVKQKDEVDYILVALPKVFTEEIRQVLVYLRDMCIDEEKMLFICGEKENLKLAKKLLPSMIVQGTYELSADQIEYAIGEIKDSFGSDFDKPGCLILDDDKDYINNLRLALKEKFDVAFSANPTGLEPFISNARVLIISIDLKIDLVQWSKLQSFTRKNSKRPDFHIILLANNYQRQAEVNRYLSQHGLCLSKETDFLKNANYIMRLHSA